MGGPFKTLAVCGPTASGKSSLGVELARQLQGEVVNVDSVQVYKEFCIGAAKISAVEQLGVPHHLLDVFSPDAPANVADFRSLALAAVADITSRNKLPVLVGGSGMYFTVLMHGLAELPHTPQEVRDRVARLSSEEVLAELKEFDPETAMRLHVNDRQRTTRALEILRVSGRKPSEIFSEHSFSAVDVLALVIVICHPREKLYRRIDSRSQAMVDAGLVDETKGLIDRYGDIPLLETLGYKQARAHLVGELSQEHLAAEIALQTRRFAKRQMTFWRNEPRKRGWNVRPSSEEEGIELEGFESAPKRAHKQMRGFRALVLTELELVGAVRERLQQPVERTEVWYVTLTG